MKQKFSVELEITVPNKGRKWLRGSGFVLAGLGLFLLLSAFTHSSNIRNGQKEKKMTTLHASGTFDVKVVPQTWDEKNNHPQMSRMLLDKQYHGDLSAAAEGQMLATMGESKSGVYVAIERVSGKLGGRSGSFMLHHSGIMTRGVPSLTVTVVPDSGTDELVGLTGKLDIKIEGGKHFYEFDYSLPTQP